MNQSLTGSKVAFPRRRTACLGQVIGLGSLPHGPSSSFAHSSALGQRGHCISINGAADSQATRRFCGFASLGNKKPSKKPIVR